jgi:hypothetical protein
MSTITVTTTTPSVAAGLSELIHGMAAVTVTTCAGTCVETRKPCKNPPMKGCIVCRHHADQIVDRHKCAGFCKDGTACIYLNKGVSKFCGTHEPKLATTPSRAVTSATSSRVTPCLSTSRATTLSGASTSTAQSKRVGGAKRCTMMTKADTQCTRDATDGDLCTQHSKCKALAAQNKCRK